MPLVTDSSYHRADMDNVVFFVKILRLFTIIDLEFVISGGLYFLKVQISPEDERRWICIGEVISSDPAFCFDIKHIL